jgi:hypothetical protein
LVERRDSPIVDVPMPVGFVMIESKSRSYGSATEGRFVEHYYQGRASKADTLNFYREALSKNQWTLRSEQNQAGTIVLQYAKGREDLNIRITEPSEVTTVQIVVRNRAGGPAKTTAVP